MLGIASLAMVLAAPAGPARAIEEHLRRLHERGAFSGAVVVSEKGRIVYEGAFGLADRERGVAFTLATPVDGASLTKTFTAASLLALADAGHLGLDEPAKRYLPELPYDLTVRQLFTHTNGLPDYDWFEPLLAADEVRTNLRWLELLRDRRPPLRMTPGQAFAYSNVGFDLAALVVERVRGLSFESFLRERFFGPLGMTDSFIRPARLSAFAGVRTRGYRPGPRWELFDAFDLEGFYGGGNLYASARDLARWNEAWIEKPPLTPAMVETGLQPVRLGQGDSGLTLLNLYRSPDGTRFWYHGHHQGFHDTIWRDLLRERSIVLVSNSTIGSDLQSGLVPDIVALLDGGTPQPPPRWVLLTDRQRAAAMGTWRVPGVGDVEILPREGGLQVRHVTGVRYALFRDAAAAFYAPGLEVWLGFETDERGQVTGLVWRTLMGGARGTRVAAPPSR
ncbi:MAG TPA: serine hydrolase domain-containing protein [Vicinamibacteria bacterium]|nr:serine hydrolase domain-containing protein [Vicinamibacteria bacterium]